eukprot:5700502-Prymnesium_polylepis.1
MNVSNASFISFISLESKRSLFASSFHASKKVAIGKPFASPGLPFSRPLKHSYGSVLMIGLAFTAATSNFSLSSSAVRSSSSVTSRGAFLISRAAA